MYWLVVQEHFNDLVIGTYRRGFWIMGDITPLQQLTPEVSASEVHLFAPRPAYRFRPITSPMGMSDDQSAGDNPPYGASINYWLKERSEDDAEEQDAGDADEKEVKIVIENAAGETVRTLDGTKGSGIQRVWWDLRDELSTEIVLRTQPLYADWLELSEERTRNHPSGGSRCFSLPALTPSPFASARTSTARP